MTAYATVQHALPAYSHRFSPKKFTQHQLFARLVLEEFLKTDHRGGVHILADCDSLIRCADEHEKCEQDCDVHLSPPASTGRGRGERTQSI
jgi:hypothetical protein